MSQEQFRNVIFPIGDLTKKEVKRIATEYGLGDIAKKKEVKISAFLLVFIDIHCSVLYAINRVLGYVLSENENFQVLLLNTFQILLETLSMLTVVVFWDDIRVSHLTLFSPTYSL